MIKAVIFDLDDTFSLTEKVCFEIENTVLKQMGHLPVSHTIHQQTWEMRPSESIPIRSPGIDIDAFSALYQSLVTEYRESGKLDRIPESNYMTLDKLAEQGKRLMVLTSRNHESVKHMLQPKHALMHRLEAFYYRGNTKFRKPDPRVFDELLSESGLQPEECVYIGDSRHDARAAKEAGLYFIASLESGLRQKEDFDVGFVDMFIEKFSDLVSAIAQLEALLASP